MHGPGKRVKRVESLSGFGFLGGGREYDGYTRTTVSHDQVTRALALLAIWPAGAMTWFFVFWPFFDFWRRRPLATYTVLFGIALATAIAVWGSRGSLLAHRAELPLGIGVVGWVLVAAAQVLAIVADRQIGIRVRSFAPFFEERGRITLKTTGAYGLVRHPIYATGIGFQLGTFLITGYWAVLAAAVALTVGALWFTRQEERRIVELLEDPTEYDRYRARVPRLFPFL